MRQPGKNPPQARQASPGRELRTLGDLTPDPENARRHTPRNVGDIVDALQTVGAARSIVIDENGVILAGNATVEAAGEAGMEGLVVVDATGDEIVAIRRTGLTPTQKRRLALADNRAAEHASWDAEVLARFAQESPDVLAGLFSDDEIAVLTAAKFVLDDEEPLEDFENEKWFVLRFQAEQWERLGAAIEEYRKSSGDTDATDEQAVTAMCGVAAELAARGRVVKSKKRGQAKVVQDSAQEPA